MRRALVLLALPPLLCACLENEETIEVHEDGSLRVTLNAHGQVADLSDGYPIPLDAGWTPASADAQRWRAELGPTGGAGMRERATSLAWKDRDEHGEPQAELAVVQGFRSAAELPRWLAPQDETYRSAYLARSTSLSVDAGPSGRVFTFERTFHGFDRARLDPLDETRIPDELRAKLDQDLELDPAERRLLIETVAAGHDRATRALLGDAMVGLLTAAAAHDGAPLHPAALVALLDDAVVVSRAIVSPERLELLLDLVRTDGDRAGEELEAIEAEWRDALRSTLEATLARFGVAPETRNAALYALEWQLSAFDHFGDLGDETFVVRLVLPGVTVAGNYDRLDGDAAVWEFDGSELDGRDVVLRATSVIDPHPR